MSDKIKMEDQIAMLKKVQVFTDTGKWEGMFSYPNCGADLVTQGLVEFVEDTGKITIAGRAVLWFLGKGDDPTEGKSFQEFTLPL